MFSPNYHSALSSSLSPEAGGVNTSVSLTSLGGRSLNCHNITKILTDEQLCYKDCFK